MSVRIGIDGSGLGPPSGINTYTIQIVNHLLDLGREDRWFLYMLEDPPPALGVEAPTLDIRRHRHPNRKIWQQLHLPLAARRDRLEVLFFPSNSVSLWTPCPSVAMVHDLHPYVAPGPYARLHGREVHGGRVRAAISRVYWKQMLRFAARKDRVIVNSETTGRDLHERFGTPRKRIDPIPLGVDTKRFNRSRDDGAVVEARRRFARGRRYILCVGTHAYKNLEGSIRAFSRVRRSVGEDPALVIVGRAASVGSAVRDLTRSEGVENDVLFTGYVPDGSLAALYHGAELLLFPSFYEGFGLPVLEAFACGTPVVTSLTGSLPEVAGDAAILVDPHDPVAIAEAVTRLFRDAGLREELVREGARRAAMFSWTEAARRTRESLGRAAGG